MSVKQWIRQFNVVPTEMIGRLMSYEPEEWREVTVPKDGRRVRVQ